MGLACQACSKKSHHPHSPADDGGAPLERWRVASTTVCAGQSKAGSRSRGLYRVAVSGAVAQLITLTSVKRVVDGRYFLDKFFPPLLEPQPVQMAAPPADGPGHRHSRDYGREKVMMHRSLLLQTLRSVSAVCFLLLLFYSAIDRQI